MTSDPGARATTPHGHEPPAAPGADPAWHQLSVEEVLARAGTAPNGLTMEQAAERLAAHGPNELVAGPRIRAVQMLLEQFKSFIIWILIVAGVVSGALGEAVDAIAILAIVVLNAVIGFYQEFNAEKSITALKAMTAPQARVRRDGKDILIATADVVAGDILILEAGDLVAADARIMAAAALTCDESTLTGESETVLKEPTMLPPGDVPLAERGNMVFKGTSIAAGTGQAVVVATAMETEIGRIAGLINEAGAEDKTPLQHKLDAFGHVLVWAALGIVALLFWLGLVRGTDPLELLLTSISLAVAAVPEGLPTVVTVALALGVLRMSRRGALVRRLAAVEALGATTVICTDKTGTLTVGEMTVRALHVAGRTYEVTGEGYGPDGVIRFAGQPVDPSRIAPLLTLAEVLLGCNHAHLAQQGGAWTTVGDPTEGALLVAGRKAGGDRERLERESPTLQEIPFDSDRKRSTVVRQLPDGLRRAFVNGAPGPLLERCTQLYTDEGVRPLTGPDRERILAETANLARQALRVLASATGDLAPTTPTGSTGATAPTPPADLTADQVERDLVFIGLAGLYDPPRPEARDAVARCRAAGIRVVMITGDHPETATTIAREIGIAAPEDVAVTGVALDSMTDGELGRRAPKIAVFARVTAADKLRIVRAWSGSGAVVAMTGDGVNDAPAVKGADIGIAMGRAGTEVTKQAADMIITDDNFATIVAAVEEGRGIYDNIRKTLQYLLAGNTGELLLMTACVIIGMPVPLLPIHLLWINLVTDGLPALCLATDRIGPDVMERPPRRRSESLTDRSFLRTMVGTGLLTAGVAFWGYYQALQSGSLEAARTAAFAVLVFAELLRSFGARSDTEPVWRIGILSNLNLVAVVAVSLGLQVWSQHNATFGRFLRTSYLPWADCLGLLALGAIPLVILEGVKVARLHRGHARAPAVRRS